MSFSAEWLALREPADLAARDGVLLSRAAGFVSNGRCVLDLGSGTGSTARAFEAQGFPGLRWRFLDNDPKLLHVACQRHPEAEAIGGNLGDIEALPLDGVGLVTASALLDLMPLRWVEALAARLRDAAIPFYAALNYDGAMEWTPPMTEDAAITKHFNIHQRSDKGLGPALGPDAGTETSRILAEHGFDVTMAGSPWSLGPEHANLQDALLDGIGAAAAETGCPQTDHWVAARAARITQARCLIGHSDLLAAPPATGL